MKHNDTRIPFAARAVLLTLAFSSFPSAHAEAMPPTMPPPASSQIRVACVGDSITQGSGTLNPSKESYPAQLQEMLGPSWTVMNFGVGGRTLIRKADPLAFGRALQSEPDVVVIMLGTNDSKPYCWDKHKADFVADYTNAITSFQNLKSKPTVFVCLPPPAFPGNWGIRQDIIGGEVVPAIKQVAALAGVVVIDTHTPLQDAKALFPDKVHPNVEGARRIAEIVAVPLRENFSGRNSPSQAVSKNERGEKQ